MLPALVVAQTQSTGKKEPESRKIDLENKPFASQASRPLPKIELPEFIITGNASIDLPDAEKILFEESPFTRRSLQEAGSRDRETVELAGRMEGKTDEGSMPFLRGRATGSIGSFFTPKLNLWLGRIDSDVEYSGSIDYFRTTGFAPHTDRSGGGLSLNGGTSFRSSLLLADMARIHGAVNYRADAYKFYGSTNPQISRSISHFSLQTSMTSPYQLPWSYEAAVGFHSNSITDTSSRVSETQLDLGLTTLYPTSTAPVRFDLNSSFSFLGGSASASLSYIELGLGFERFKWKDWYLTASARVYGAGGMNDQSLSKLYPHLSLGYQLSQYQAVEVYYNPQVEYWNVMRHTVKNPYLSSVSAIRHADAYLAGGVAWQAHWSEQLKTKVSVEAKSSRDYPLYADSTSQGMWLLAYGGTTTVVNYKGELFAKFSPNDYFASALVMSPSRNSVTGKGIPYLPDVELSATYSHEFPAGVSVTGDLTFFRGQVDNVVNASTLKGALLLDARAEYRMLSFLRTFLELRNITNERYELWKGYQAFPFTMAVGLTAVW